MSDPLFDELDDIQKSQDASAVIGRLIDTIRERGEIHHLLAALMLKKRHELGLSLLHQPASSSDVPAEMRDDFESAFIEAIREVGQRYLDGGDIPHAWHHFSYIGEPDPVKNALEAIEPAQADVEDIDDIVRVALYEGAHPVKGLEIMLAVNGMCNSITAMEQQMPHLGETDRQAAAALLVRELSSDLCATVRSEVESRLAGIPAGETLSELIAERDWLFEDGNYHVDVSHLNAVVRFARFLSPEAPELRLAAELCEYGGKLAAQFQYPAEPPFDHFYPAHHHYFGVLRDEGRAEGLAYFRQQIEEEPDEEDRPAIAFYLVDLMMRIGQYADALDLARRYFPGEEVEEFSYAALCQKAGQLDTLRETARETDDPVTYAAAMLEST